MVDYCTQAELLPQINKLKPTPEDITVFASLITAASRAIDRYCNRPDGFVAISNATARQYSGTGDYVQLIDECIEITLVETKQSVTDNYTSWATADWIAFSGDPRFPNFNSLPYDAVMTSGNGALPLFHSGRVNHLRGFRPDQDYTNRGLPTVRITAKWGYAAAVPEPIKEACLIQCARWYKRGQSAWADALANSDFGTLTYVKSLDPAIKHLLDEGRFVRPTTR